MLLRKPVTRLLCLFLATSQLVFAQNKTEKDIPHLEKRGETTQLIVDGKPYLILGGELHNSSTSSLEYLKPIMPALAAMNLNTALAAVTWDLMEPVEGKYDFTLVDGLLKQARESKIHLVLLWFGSWKNGESQYAPDWVKADYKRFPRVKLDNGHATETMSAFSEAGLKADARAFAALMKHVKEVDSHDRTVIMVQVENEVGIIGAARDHSDLANAAFSKPVPSTLMSNLAYSGNEMQQQFQQKWQAAGGKTAGTWVEVFGNGYFAEEAFMAYNYAGYINTVAAAGKAEYPLPMYVNAWIVQPEDRIPGDYPSGGPQAHMHNIWRATAPNIDIFCPDIYLPDFKGITGLYKHTWNPLFIPESFNDSAGAANAYYAIGYHKAIGYSPFGIDGIRAEHKQPSAILTKTYKILGGMAPLILEAQAKGTITAVSLDKQNPVQTVNMGGYNLEVALRRSRGEASTLKTGYAIIINTGPDEFILSGINLQVTFSPATPGPKTAGLASVYEGGFDNGQWIPGRKLNGDNIMLNYRLAEEAAAYQTGSVARFEGPEPGTLKVKLYRFE